MWGMKPNGYRCCALAFFHLRGCNCLNRFRYIPLSIIFFDKEKCLLTKMQDIIIFRH